MKLTRKKEFVKAFTWGWGSRRGEWLTSEAMESLNLLIEKTNINTIVLALAALQEKPQSVLIDYSGEHIVSDEELRKVINIAKSKGLKVILKPTVNVRDGTWRAHINFFNIDVPCEPKWSEWFASYSQYIIHYARIAQETNCEMLVIGCEMVQAEKRETEWRNLICEVREFYKGPITYNTDKYQEDQVSWWDAVDIISSSGYYPVEDWDRQLDRINKVFKKYNKSFLFMEAGCQSKKGSSKMPNNWGIVGVVDQDEQADYYRVMFEKIDNCNWISGIALWDWPAKLYDKKDVDKDCDYNVFEKKAEKVIKTYFSK
jgi:hypothetical protein